MGEGANILLDSIPYVGAISSLLSLGGGLLGSKSSPQEDYYKQMSDMAKGYMPYLSSTAFSKSDLDNIVKSISGMYRGAANVSAGAVGASLGERLNASGVPNGQPSASMYVSELAPIIAQGEQGAAGATQWGTNLFADLDAQAKSRTLNALKIMGDFGIGMPTQTSGQRGLMSGLSSLDLLMKGYGNFAQAYKDFNTKDTN